MKIAFVADMLKSGGAQKMMSFVINCIGKDDNEITIILQDTSEIAYKLPKHAVVVPFKCEAKILTYPNWKIMKFWSLIKRSLELKNLIKTNKIDVVCGFGSYYATMSVIAAMGTNAKTVVSERRSPANLDAIWRLISKWTYKKADRVVFQLEGARDFYKRIKQECTCIIPNPYLGTGECRNDENIIRKKTIVMAAARLEDVKGFDVGIAAMKYVVEYHPDYIMEIYGAGDFEGMYGQIISAKGLNSHVKYMGLSKNLIADIYDAAVFLLPSRFEGIPNALMEAMSVGIPCVAADCPPGGPRMLLQDGRDGVLVPVDDIKETAKALCSIIENPFLSKQLSVNAINVKNRFSPDVISKKWCDLFKGLFS